MWSHFSRRKMVLVCERNRNSQKIQILGVHSNNEIVKCLCLQRLASKAKGKLLDLMRTVWSLGSFDTTVFFQLFDAQIKPMLLYASEVWGTSRLANIETAHLFACKRLLSVSDETPNHMVHGETGSNLSISTVLFLPLDTGLNSVRCP